MGLFDKVKDAFAKPDLAAVLQEQLGSERYLGYAAVMASSTESGRRKSIRDVTDAAQAAAHHLTDKYIQNKHIGGDEDSIARKLPRSQDLLALTLSDGSLTLWKFGLGAKKTNPDQIARIPRELVASVADTGSRKAHGHIRVSFTDGSFFDYQTPQAASDEFWAAATGFGTGGV